MLDKGGYKELCWRVQAFTSNEAARTSSHIRRECWTKADLGSYAEESKGKGRSKQGKQRAKQKASSIAESTGGDIGELSAVSRRIGFCTDCYLMINELGSH